MLDHPPVDVYKRLSPSGNTERLTTPFPRYSQAARAIWAVIWAQVWNWRTAAMAGLALTLARTSLPAEVHPFIIPAVAVAATLKARTRGLLVASAAVAGLATTEPWLVTFPYLIVAVLLFSEIRTEEQALQRYRFTVPLLAAANLWIVRTLMIFLLGQAWFTLLPVTLEAVLDYALTAMLLHLSTLKKEIILRRGMTRVETAAVVAVGAAAVEGLQGLTLGPVVIHELLQWWIIILAGWAVGPGGGAAAGIAAAIIEGTLGEVGIARLAPYAITGVTAGIFAGRGKPGVLLGGLLGVLLCSAMAISRTEMTRYLLHGGLVLAMVLLTTPLKVKQAARLFRGTAEFDRIRQMQWQNARDRVAKHLDETSKVFSSLSENFTETNGGSEKPEAVVLVTAAAQRACTGCERKEHCWEKGFYHTYRDFLDLLTLAEVSGSASLMDIPPRLKVKCTLSHRVVSAVNYLLDVYRLNNAWEQRLAESREIVAVQLKSVSRVIGQLSEKVKNEEEGREQLEERILQAMEKARLPVQYVRVTDIAREHQAVEVVMDACRSATLCRQNVPAILQRCLGKPMVPLGLPCDKQSRGREGMCVLHYVPRKAFELTVRVATASKDKGTECGDRHAWLELPGGKVAILLSDGMGTGETAAKESGIAVSMLTQLIRAGFDHDFAVRTVNSALLLRSREESFATMDLCITDLYTGKAEFVKIGAAPTYIKRGDQVFVLKKESLPVGILNTIDIDNIEWDFRPDDLVVMVTDGISEASGFRGSDDWVERLLQRLETEDPGEVAAYLLQQARERRGQVGDDMTVVAGRFSRRPD